mgnify:CR=1 FL=1|tara:strand:+ start:284 stop:481 length:198 start_codon:yes stop_codon:yes gene_type:complete
MEKSMALTKNSLKNQINKLKLQEARLVKQGNFKRIAKVRKAKENKQEIFETREKELAQTANLGHN